jgi:hypothetical protein
VELNPELETVDEAIALVDSLENPEIREKLVSRATLTGCR